MMSIDAVFPAIGGIGIRVIGTVVMFVLTAGRSVGGGVDATGRLACAGPVSTVAFAHGVAVAAVVAAAAEVAGADEDVVAGLAQAAMKNAPAMIVWTGRCTALMSSSRCGLSLHPPVNGASAAGRATKRALLLAQ